MKTIKTNSVKVIIIVVLSFISISANAQTFRCTDIDIYEKLSDKKMKEQKDKMLGAIMKLEFYDNDLRMTLVDSSGKDKETEVYSKINSNKYQLTWRLRNKENTLVLELEKFMGFIKTVRLSGYEENEIQVVAVFKREYF